MHSRVLKNRLDCEITIVEDIPCEIRVQLAVGLESALCSDHVCSGEVANPRFQKVVFDGPCKAQNQLCL